MAKGKRSLVRLLIEDGIENPWQYIRFYSLRTHGIMPKTGMPMQEMIYIHSKCMIVDDTHVILGSANINDRSMLGSRDHETCVVISQSSREDCLTVQLGGQSYKVSKLVHSFRTELMMEHFGLSYDEVKDPIARKEELFKIAESNSRVFAEIFRCEPDNDIQRFTQLSRIRELRR